MAGVRREEPEKQWGILLRNNQRGEDFRAKRRQNKSERGRKRGLYPREKLCAQWHKIPLKAAAL